MKMIKEEWRPAIYVDRHGNVYDYTDKYEVSNLGNVRSYPKKTHGGIDHKNIISVCNGKRKSAGGSFWKRKGD